MANIKIALTGALEQWQNKWVYDAQLPAPLPDPTPFTFEVSIPQDAVNETPGMGRGAYTSNSSAFIFTMGAEIRIERICTRVEVYSGLNNLYGVWIGNKYMRLAYGVMHPAFWGFCAFFMSPFNGPAFPTDELHWVYDSQGWPMLKTNMHAYMQGAAIQQGVEVSAEADNIISPYSAVLVP